MNASHSVEARGSINDLIKDFRSPKAGLAVGIFLVTSEGVRNNKHVGVIALNFRLKIKTFRKFIG